MLQGVIDFYLMNVIDFYLMNVDNDNGVIDFYLMNVDNENHYQHARFTLIFKSNTFQIPWIVCKKRRIDDCKTFFNTKRFEKSLVCAVHSCAIKALGVVRLVNICLFAGLVEDPVEGRGERCEA